MGNNSYCWLVDFHAAVVLSKIRTLWWHSFTKPIPKDSIILLILNLIQLKYNFSETMYATLPKSWKEQNLITQTEVMEDLEELAKRQKLTQEKTPAELAQISSK